jgi:16S rRNA (guanine(966)-N(2))-methyltransferase RsmD
LRETLFNILAPQIAGARFLDLCAGTGAVGVEALSRGADQVTFVDQSRKMCGLIQANLEALSIEDGAELVTADVLEFLRRREKKVAEPFDIIFFDPPYASDYESVLKDLAARQGLLADNGVVVVEHHKKTELAEAFGQMHRYRVLKQGDSVLSFFSV